MLPSILARQYQEGLIDYIDTSFPITNPIFKGSIRNMLNTKDAVFHEPYVAVRLPFRVYEGNKSLFEAIHQPFSPYVHQQRAFERLTGEDGRSTLIATGTGSGKTECFLYPILEYCYKHRGEKGIKALIIYPMNALASDQAKRIAELVDGSEELKSAGIRVGMYVGGQEHSSVKMMLPDKVITDHETLLAAPPDILMTNYKMLDYLLVRPKDAELWKNNLPDTLKYIAVDELHTFDGAQGTDLACLLRRLKARLNVLPGQICCIGTSATMGAKDSAKSIREYASDVFGEMFDEDAVVTEDRLSSEEFFAGYDVTKYIVYTPTFRDYETVTEGNLRSILGYVDCDLLKLSKILLKFNAALILKLHPLQNKTVLKKDLPKGILVFEQTYKYGLYDLLSFSDGMITDYTSTYFDFLLVNKPVIFNFYDIEEYRRVRGFSFEPIEFFCAGDIVYNYNELIDAVMGLLAGKDIHAEHRRHISLLMNQFQDDNSTKRICDIFLNEI
jgi:hypothetical protein